MKSADPQFSTYSSQKQPSPKLLEFLKEERKRWRKEHPFGFSAKPSLDSNNQLNYLSWKCSIPGPKNTLWSDGTYELTMTFPCTYPPKLPLCIFSESLPHPNIYASGTLLLSMLKSYQRLKENFSICDILLNIQQFLGDPPNLNKPANHHYYKLYREEKQIYAQSVIMFIKAKQVIL